MSCHPSAPRRNNALNDLRTTFYPRTFAYCPDITQEGLVSAYESCVRLFSNLPNASAGMLVRHSVTWNYTAALSLRFIESSDVDHVIAMGYELSSAMSLANATISPLSCGPDFLPITANETSGLSCVNQVMIAPSIKPGGGDDSYYGCSESATNREEWGRFHCTNNLAEVIIVLIVVGVFYAIPVAFHIAVYLLRGHCGDGIARARRSADRPSAEAVAAKEVTVVVEQTARPFGAAAAAAAAPAMSGAALAAGGSSAAIGEQQRWLASQEKHAAKAAEAAASEPSGGRAPPFQRAPSSSVSTRSKRRARQGGEAGRVYLSFEAVYYSITLNASARKAKQVALLAAGLSPETFPAYWDVKRIIHDASGCFAPGSLSAIMGPSGCGKSTLLDILADRKTSGHVAGSILMNGHERGAYFKRAAAYVMQFDALFEMLTVREMLTYTAELRITGNDDEMKSERVQTVIDELDLGKVADSRIGGAGLRGISGGQARRVTVGVELVTRPSVLFLDEPTTGLDAYSSLLLVRSLRALADSGRTVLCTIHQPRPDIFALFDTLLLMAAGEVAYFAEQATIGRYLERVVRLHIAPIPQPPQPFSSPTTCRGLPCLRRSRRRPPRPSPPSQGLTIPPEVNPADFVVDLTYSRGGEGPEADVNAALIERTPSLCQSPPLPLLH